MRGQRMSLVDVDPVMFQINVLDRERAPPGAHAGIGKPYSQRMLNIILLTLKQMFEQAAEDHVIAANPAQKVTLHEKVLTPHEEKRALTALEGKLFAQLVETHEHGLFFKVLYRRPDLSLVPSW